MDLQPKRNAAAGPFSTQPEGLWLFSDFSALLARARSFGHSRFARTLKNQKIADSKWLAIYHSAH